LSVAPSGLQLDPEGDDYAGFVDRLRRSTNQYAIWLIIIGAVVLLFLVMRKLFK
jgi:hypothetical protein